MSGAAEGGPAQPGRGGRTKSGKARPGTGGYGKRKLEGKGPTPPAHLRPGHPAQRRAAAKAAGRAGRGAPPPDGSRADRAPDRGGRTADRGGRAADRARGAGDAPEVVAGRNAVLESLRAHVPATALYAGPGTAPTRGSTR